MKIDWSNLREALAEVDQWVDAYPADTVLALWEARAWEMLDYANWEALCDARGWTKRVALPRPERREIVSTLRQEGMSTRAIAAATGVGVGTVHRDLAAGVPSGTPEVRGTDGKTYAPTQPVRVKVEVIEDSQVERAEVLTAEEWAEREGVQLVADEPDPDDFLPEQSKFERAFWRHLRSGQELVTDLEYPHHFNEPMTRMLLDLIESLNQKRDAISARGLRVVNGGKQ